MANLCLHYMSLILFALAIEPYIYIASVLRWMFLPAAYSC